MCLLQFVQFIHQLIAYKIKDLKSQISEINVSIEQTLLFATSIWFHIEYGAIEVMAKNRNQRHLGKGFVYFQIYY